MICVCCYLFALLSVVMWHHAMNPRCWVRREVAREVTQVFLFLPWGDLLHPIFSICFVWFCASVLSVIPGKISSGWRHSTYFFFGSTHWFRRERNCVHVFYLIWIFILFFEASWNFPFILFSKILKPSLNDSETSLCQCFSYTWPPL